MIREEALTYLRRKLGKVASGETIAPERLKIADLLQLVSNDYELKERASSYIAQLKIAKYLLPVFGETRVMKFRSAQVEAFIKQRQNQKAAAATINRELALLRRAFQLGYRADPPMVARVPHIPKLPENNARTGFYSSRGTASSSPRCRSNFQLLLVFGYHLGMRKSALLQLKWKQVDFKAGLIYLERKKSAKNIRTPFRFTAI
jgi:integrase